MSVKIDNFVQVNITKRALSPLRTNYDTAVFVAGDSILSLGYYTLTGSASADGTKAKPYGFADLTDVSSDYPYLKLFFDCGGKYLHVVDDIETDSSSGTGWVYKTNYAEDEWEELPLSEIVIFAGKTPTTDVSGNLTGIYQKIFIDYATSSAEPAAKYSGNLIKYTEDSTAYCMAAAAAYLTKINLNDAASLADYAFTAETAMEQAAYKYEITDSDAAVSACIANHLNCDTYLAGTTRNIGGDDATGESIMNVLLRIVLQQELSTSLCTLLVSKIKLNQNGIVGTKNAVSNVLTRFVNNGYIATDKVWAESDLYIDGELVAATDMPLIDGYVIHVSPITPENVANHQIPAIYILYGDSTGIRKIVVSGEVF